MKKVLIYLVAVLVAIAVSTSACGGDAITTMDELEEATEKLEPEFLFFEDHMEREHPDWLEEWEVGFAHLESQNVNFEGEDPDDFREVIKEVEDLKNTNPEFHKKYKMELGWFVNLLKKSVRLFEARERLIEQLSKP